MRHLSKALREVNCKDGLADFLKTYLLYEVSPVSYKPSELQIPPYLAKETSAWWLLSHYRGKSPFQIHLVETKNFTFQYCGDVLNSFYQRYAGGHYLFIFTKDYSYLFLATIEWSLERRPQKGHKVWPKLPKPYCRSHILNRYNPTANDIQVIKLLRLEHSDAEPSAIFEKTVQALNSSRGDVPEWFMPWYYRLGFPPSTWEKLKGSGKI